MVPPHQNSPSCSDADEKSASPQAGRTLTHKGSGTGLVLAPDLQVERWGSALCSNGFAHCQSPVKWPESFPGCTIPEIRTSPSPRHHRTQEVTALTWNIFKEKVELLPSSAELGWKNRQRDRNKLHISSTEWHWQTERKGGSMKERERGRWSVWRSEGWWGVRGGGVCLLPFLLEKERMRGRRRDEWMRERRKIFSVQWERWKRCRKHSCEGRGSVKAGWRG